MNKISGLVLLNAAVGLVCESATAAANRGSIDFHSSKTPIVFQGDALTA
jgi:hypothetical protein